MKQATAMPARRAGYFENNEVVQNRVYRSLKLWSLYADLEEAFGTNEVTFFRFSVCFPSGVL